MKSPPKLSNDPTAGYSMRMSKDKRTNKQLYSKFFLPASLIFQHWTRYGDSFEQCFTGRSLALGSKATP